MPIDRGVDQVAPPFPDSVKNTCGESIVPLTYDMTMRSVASAPVGAPFAMSTLGAGARSLRAPATPSITGRPRAGSKTTGWVTGPSTGVGLDHDPPPLVDVDINSKLWLPAEDNVPMSDVCAVA